MIEGISLVSQKDNVSQTKPVAPVSGVDLSKQFSDMLHAALNQTNEQKAITDHLSTQFVTGELSDIHKLMIETEKAAIGLELTVQVRNKVIEAYQEIMRMQI